MKIVIDVDRELGEKVLDDLISGKDRSSQDVFDQIRKTFKSLVEAKLCESGVKTSPRETRKRNKKGVEIHELNVINGMDESRIDDLDYRRLNQINGKDESRILDFGYNGYWYSGEYGDDLPSLNSFLKVDSFAVGDVLCVVENKDIEVEIRNTGKLKLVGYAHDVKKRNRKSFVTFYGLHFDNDFIRSSIKNLILECDCELCDLDEVRIDQRDFPITYVCRVCGKLYTCSCFYSALKENIKMHPGNLDNIGVEDIGVKDNLCHLCTKETPKIRYGSSMYYSVFMQLFLPYHRLYTFRKHGSTSIILQFNMDTVKKLNDETENQLREYFGYPKIGEKWISETHLYKLVCSLHPENEVIFHYRGRELEGLELDIFIPELSLGIEYQGVQHYKSIKHWGGEEGLKKRMESDKRKKKICKSLGYELIEYRHDEEISEKNLVRKLRKLIR